VTLAAQQPLVNMSRVTIQALAAVLGGTQSLHTNSYDEALGLPTPEAATLALRTQQVIAHESGVADFVDPLAGSYAIETLTNTIEERTREYLRKIDELGGMVPAIEQSYPQREIERRAYEHQRAVERKERIVVGVNEFAVDNEVSPAALHIDPSLERKQCERVAKLRATRDATQHRHALQALKACAESKDNLLPAILASVKAYATVGEIADVLRSVFGEYRPS
jgi:methylmalonyl-CoA mutase N-terminal domain/subunit